MRTAQKNIFFMNRQKGQATTEYVLLIVITLVLVTALANQIYRPFNKWLDNYMGAYLQCLLDAGELPDLGWGGGGVCDEDYQPFTVADGRPLREKSASQANSETDSKNDQKKGSPLENRTSGASASGSAGRPSDLSRKGFPIGKGPAADGVGEGEGKTQEVAALPPTRYNRNFTVGSSSGSGKTAPATGVAGLLAAEKEKIERRQSRTRTLANDESAAPQPKKFSIKKPERKIASEEEEEPWSFGKLIRIAIIVMIIMAVLLFLGGQALQISKSMEK